MSRAIDALIAYRLIKLLVTRFSNTQAFKMGIIDDKGKVLIKSEVERVVYKHLKEQGFEFKLDEKYGEPLSEGTYKVKHDIYNLEGDIVINIDEQIDFKTVTDTILGYDVFKYKDVYLTTEDLYAN